MNDAFTRPAPGPVGAPHPPEHGDLTLRQHDRTEIWLMSVDVSEHMDAPPLEFSECRAGSGPLAWAQKGMWNNIRALAPDDQHLNVMLTLEAPDGGSSVDRVLTALRTLVARHDALRTTFRRGDDDQPVQTVAGQGAVPVALATGPDAVRRLSDAQSGLAARRFDLEVDLPWRVGLAMAGGRVQSVVLCLSHLVVDGWATQLLLEELAALLAGTRALPPVTRQPIEQARYEREVLAPRLGQRVPAHWRKVLSTCQLGDETFTLRGEPATPRFWQGSYLSEASSCASRMLAARHGVSQTSVFLAAAARVLTVYAGRDTLPVLLRVTNRFAPEVKRSLVYLCQNTPVLLENGGAPFPRLVRSAHQAALRAYQCSQYDPDDVRSVLDEIHQPDIIPDLATLNLVSHGAAIADDRRRPERPDGAKPRNLLQDSSFTWRRKFDNERIRLFLSVFRGVSYQVIGDTCYFPPEQIEATARLIEATLVDEAERDSDPLRPG
ncbi:condensation domain-containing protein [Nonomuraea sp. KM88]|uniref:condensation domain-containing protein n=1 Tax=Nonomuraea sp. KM88 TaxID=3457427 RepID=UPI003FCE5C50